MIRQSPTRTRHRSAVPSSLLRPPGRGQDQLLPLGQGFLRLIAPLLRNASVEQAFPKGAVPSEIDNHGLPSPYCIDNELDAWDFLEWPDAHPHGVGRRNRVPIVSVHQHRSVTPSRSQWFPATRQFRPISVIHALRYASDVHTLCCPCLRFARAASAFSQRVRPFAPSDRRFKSGAGFFAYRLEVELR
jgi:hypothetical protein